MTDNERSTTIRDSAGIEIVFNRRPESSEAWTVDSIPLLQIGEVAGAEAYLFSRVSSVVGLSDRRIVVLEGLTREIRVFARDGEHLHTFGGTGAGPGEFRSVPTIVGLPGDTLLLWDRTSFRFSWLLPDGSLVRDQSYDPTAERSALGLRPPSQRILLPDGTLFFSQEVIDLKPLDGPSEMGRVMARSPFRENSITDRVAQIALVFDHGTTGINLGKSYPHYQSITRNGNTVQNFAFPRSAFVAEGVPARIHVSGPDSWAVRTLRPDGSTARIVRLELRRRAVTRAMIDAQLHVALDITRDSSLTVESFTRFSYPDSLFPIIDLSVDRSGNLWLREQPAMHYENAQVARYQIVDPSGRWLASAVLPKSLGGIAELGPDYIITIWRDENNVPYVRMYRLEKSQ